jgi:crotonobetainyl-CoA:carnitine CoA-transferase CaiB-like acyl-CoA transferase
MAGGPLEGVTIVDLTSVVVGPLATQILADHGADVIKVEAPSGDIVRSLAGKGRNPNMSGKFLHLNRNKRSLVLDLKKPEAYAALMQILATADVMVWNMRPPALKRLKLTYEDIKKVNPKIICCGMYGFGQDGPYKDKPAYDSIIQGSGGTAALYQMATGEPRYLPMVVADRTVGLIAVQMILMALFHREKTGQGQSIELPMFENIVKATLEEHMYLKTFVPPLGAMGDPRLIDPQSRPLPTLDGYICVSANTNDQAFAVFDAIERPELKVDPRFSTVAARFKNTADYFGLRAEALKKKTTAHWMTIFEASDVPAMPFQTLDQILEDPHLKAVGFFETIDHPSEGKIINMKLPNRLSLGARKDFLPAPKIGQHSVQILRQAGFSEALIKTLIDSGATLDGSAPEHGATS